jgi:hypothetical protein
MRKVLLSTDDIAGDKYLSFIEAASKHFSSVSLVWKHGLPYSESRHRIGSDLKRRQISQRQGNSWPGTSWGELSTVVLYDLDAIACEVLTRPGSLFGWITPGFPEDLAFYEKNGDCGFASVSHEHYAWILDWDFAALLPNDLGFSEEQWSDNDYAEVRQGR